MKPSSVDILLKDITRTKTQIKAQIVILSGKDLPKEGMTTHSSIFAWRIWEGPGGLDSLESQSRTQLK